MSVERMWLQESCSPSDESNPLDPYIEVLRLADRLRLGFEKSLDGIGLSWARYEVLEALAERGTMTYSDLGRFLVRHRTSIGETVCALEKSGFVVREPNRLKQQQFVVRSTTSGQAKTAHARRVLSRDRARHIDRNAALSALDAIRQHLLDTGSEPHRSATPLLTVEDRR